jgi:hypothetical protein
VSIVVRNTIFRKAPPSVASGYDKRSINFNKVVATFGFIIRTNSKPTMDNNLQHHNLLGNQISSKWENFCILADILDGHHSKQRMDINSQHHNLLGNQISSKSEEFSIFIVGLLLVLIIKP